MSPKGTPGIFEAWGIEIEYMVVDPATFRVRPMVDELFRVLLGEYGNEIDQGDTAWSNELAAHVLEFKTPEPFGSWNRLDDSFRRSVSVASGELTKLGGVLMGGGVHPLMDPATETRLWPHENREIYEKFHHLFDCRGHGWSNLQSAHLNLSFRGDREFHRLHSAIRLVLPLIPALAAASPILDGHPGGMQDLRLHHYRDNSKNIPEITGMVIPEPVTAEAEYDRVIYDPIRNKMAPHDPDGILEPEWLNARGAIARFDRGSIEIRLADAQENPVCDLAVMSAIAAVVRGVEGLTEPRTRDQVSTPFLSRTLLETVQAGEYAVIESEPYLELLGLPPRPRMAGDLWKHLLEAHGPSRPRVSPAVDQSLYEILEHGTLSTRILRAMRRQGMDRILEGLIGAMHQDHPFRS